jgi:5-formyltetrahydrofolate cyclo-ligase
MIFDSLGLGELGIIAVVAVLFIDPSKVGLVARQAANLRRKWNNIQREVKQQIDTLTLEENLRDSVDSVRAAKAALRLEAREAVRALPASERSRAADEALARLLDWAPWREAKVVSLFSGTLEELDTENIIRHALSEGKTVLLPWIQPAAGAGGKARMALAPVADYDRDLVEGAYGILEPVEGLRGAETPEPDLILVPGTAFDERGGRVGRGKGFYDRFLEDRTGLKAGLAFEAQVLRKKLPLEAHDQLLDGLVTERTLRIFSQSRPENGT